MFAVRVSIKAMGHAAVGAALVFMNLPVGLVRGVDPAGGKSIFDLDGRPINPATRPAGPVLQTPPGPPSPANVRPAAPPSGEPMEVPGINALSQAEQALKSSMQPYPPASAADRGTLAKKLLARGSASTDAAEKFICLRESRDLAAGVGDVTTAWRALSETGKAFVVATLQTKLDLLARFEPASLQGAEAKSLAQLCFSTGAEAVVADEFDQAEKVLGIGLAAAKASEDSALVELATARAADLAGVREDSQRVKPHEKRLAADPNDPVANFAVGRFRCFRKGDWQGGLPLLAKGYNKMIRGLAEQELSKPETPQKQLELANQWCEQAKLQPAGAQGNLLAHASVWYAAALPGLSGADKSLAEERIAQNPPPVVLTSGALASTATAGKPDARAVTVPKEFWFNNGGPAGDPATRHWVQTDESSWEERYPNGNVSHFKVDRTEAYGTITGLVVRKLNEAPVEVLIPPATEGAAIYFRFIGKGEWVPLARIHLGPLPQ